MKKPNIHGIMTGCGELEQRINDNPKPTPNITIAKASARSIIRGPRSVQSLVGYRLQTYHVEAPDQYSRLRGVYFY